MKLNSVPTPSPENEFEATDSSNATPGIIRELGQLEPKAIIYEEGLAKLFDRHLATVKRAVRRGELPPPIRIFGQNAWTVETLIKHFEMCLETAAQKAQLKVDIPPQTK
jgi:hypothetical protein